jgi:hypothetical protein
MEGRGLDRGKERKGGRMGEREEVGYKVRGREG